MADRRSPIGLPDRYRLEGRIAAGGMAVVYAAHDTVLDRPVAVKVLAEHLGHDETARRRFEREARAAAALSSHPGVVTTFDVGEHDDRAFIVMERRDGGSVADRLSAGTVSHGTALEWLRDVADALDAAHARGIVHRDVKPANLLLDGNGRVAVADFGIASLAHESQVTMTGQVLGSAAYISPEQAMGRSATAASDVYALACVAFELLTGARPYPGDTFAAQARAHVDDPVPRAPGLPPGAQAALARGMAKEPADRPRSAAALVDGLAAGLDGAAGDETEATRVLGAPVVTPRPPDRRGQTTAGYATAPVYDDEPEEDRRRGRGGIVVLAAIAALLAGLAVVLLLGSGDGSTADQARTSPTPTATSKPKRTPTPTPTAEETATATATPEATATPTETAEADSSGGGGQTASQLNSAGFERIQAGDFAGAVGFLTDAVAACDGSTELDPCGYALFNLGQSLNRSGRPAEAIPYLQQRLENFSFKRDEVQAELDAACQAAGDACGQDASGPGSGGAAAAPAAPGNGNGNGKAKGPGGPKGPKG